MFRVNTLSTIRHVVACAMRLGYIRLLFVILGCTGQSVVFGGIFAMLSRRVLEVSCIRGSLIMIFGVLDDCRAMHVLRCNFQLRLLFCSVLLL